MVSEKAEGMVYILASDVPLPGDAVSFLKAFFLRGATSHAVSAEP